MKGYIDVHGNYCVRCETYREYQSILSRMYGYEIEVDDLGGSGLHDGWYIVAVYVD